MPWARFALWGSIATFALGAVALGADALVESDEERIAEFADALAGERADRRIDALLAWVDTTRLPVTVRAGGSTERFAEQDGDPGDAIRRALAPLEAEPVEVVQRSVAVEGERATIALRVRSEGEIVDLLVELAREGRTWLVRGVRRID